MRNRSLPLVLAMMLCAASLAAQEESSQPQSETPPGGRPEHQVRPLPADTFLPSEEISEDFPVPFPVDI